MEKGIIDDSNATENREVSQLAVADDKKLIVENGS
jgi:hypothetical protein